MPPEKLVEGLGRQEQRLYDIWFQLESASREQLEFGGISWESWRVERPATVFELSLVLHEYGDKVWGDMEYDPDLFEDETIAHLADGLRGVLNKMVSKPDGAISKPTVSAEYNRQLRQDFMVDLHV
jgi:hypothetical protein